MEEAWHIAKAIHELAEVGSREFRSQELLANAFRQAGFTVETGYCGVPTAFRAEKNLGPGPRVCILAEYDALPGVGHACGHNLISGSAYLTAIKMSQRIKSGSIVVIGTPDEEGSGEWAGSKIIILERGGFKDIDFVLMTHPGTEWSVGSPSLAVQDFQVTFKGIAAHEAATPEKGVSALDAAILTYTAVNMMRQHVRRDANVVIHDIIKEGGMASNVTPECAVLVYGLRSSDSAYLNEIISKFKRVLEGCSLATGATYEAKPIGPMYLTTKFNFPLMKEAETFLAKSGVEVVPYSESTVRIPRGSTDFANVSQLLPSLEVSCKIAPKDTPWHSRLSAQAAISEDAMNALELVSECLASVGTRLITDPRFAEDVKKAFELS